MSIVHDRHFSNSEKLLNGQSPEKRVILRWIIGEETLPKERLLDLDKEA